MKGVSVRTVVLIVLGIIVLAVSLFFLTFVSNLDTLFLSEDQRTLRQYATCSLALCSDGVYSDGRVTEIVNKVGCLERDGSGCTKTCSDVAIEYYNDRVTYNDYIEEHFDQLHFCGKKVGLTFNFEVFGATVPLASGQMDKISKSPEWVCKPLKIPFTNVYIDDWVGNVPGVTTADMQYLNDDRNCVMLAKLSDIGPSALPNLFNPDDDEYVYGGCFAKIYADRENFEDFFTPILEYDIEPEIVHPSAIYLDKFDDFTKSIDGAPPECNLASPDFNITEAEIIDMREELNNQGISLRRFQECELSDIEVLRIGILDLLGLISEDDEAFKKASACSDYIKYSFNELSDDQQEKFAYFILREERREESGSRTFGKEITKCNFKTVYDGSKIDYTVYSESTLTLISASLGSCKAVVLDRDLDSSGLDTSSNSNILSVKFDKGTYSPGDTVKITGKIESEDDVIENKIKINIFREDLGNVPVGSVGATLLDDGTFEAEFGIGEGVDVGAVFRVTVEYLGATKSEIFDVGKEA